MCGTDRIRLAQNTLCLTLAFSDVGGRACARFGDADRWNSTPINGGNQVGASERPIGATYQAIWTKADAAEMLARAHS